jgi:hypothetical protein
MRFRTTVEQAGKTATGIEVPSTVVAGLGAGKRPPVRVTINGFTYRSTVASMDGRFMVGVSAENRAGAKVDGGDVVDVDIELDTAPRVVEVPKDLATVKGTETSDLRHAASSYSCISAPRTSRRRIRLKSGSRAGGPGGEQDAAGLGPEELAPRRARSTRGGPRPTRRRTIRIEVADTRMPSFISSPRILR